MVDVVGVVVLVIFYVAITLWGIVAAYWFKKKRLGGASGEEVDLVAGRQIGVVVGIFTMTGQYYRAKDSIRSPYK